MKTNVNSDDCSRRTLLTAAAGVGAALAVGPTRTAAQTAPSWSASLGDYPAECAVEGSTVFVADDSGSVTAFDADDGTVRATTSTGKEMASLGASATHVAAGAEDGSLYSIDAESMSTNWHRSLSGLLNGVTVAGNVAYAVTEVGTCYAIDLDSGATKWRKDLSGEDPATPVVGEYVYARSGGDTDSGGVYAFDPESGETVWQASIASGDHAYDIDADIALSPDGTDLAANYMQGEDVAGVTLFDAADGQKQWSARAPSGDDVGAVAVDADRVVYEGDRHVYGHDRATGDLQWNSGQGVAGELTADAGRIYYVAEFDDTNAVRGSRSDTGIVTWETEKTYSDYWGGDASATHYYALHDDGIEAYRREKSGETTTETTTTEATTESPSETTAEPTATESAGAGGSGTTATSSAETTVESDSTTSSATTQAAFREATTVSGDGRGLFVAGDGVLRGQISTWMLTVSGFALSIVGLVYSMRRED